METGSAGLTAQGVKSQIRNPGISDSRRKSALDEFYRELGPRAQ